MAMEKDEFLMIQEMYIRAVAAEAHNEGYNKGIEYAIEFLNKNGFDKAAASLQAQYEIPF